MAGEFDKDFGYLLPFLDRVANAGASLSDPAARARLKELIAGEKERWTQIRELLATPSGTTEDATAEPLSTERAAVDASDVKPIRYSSPAQFTVGSLRGRSGN